MPISDQTLRTIKCDNAKCDKIISFDLQDQAAIAALPDWLRTYRNVVLGNNTKFGYCSDVCEVEGVTSGTHNVPEPKQVQEASPADAQRVAAQAAIVEAMKTAPKGKGKVSLK
jgi:hypothetical protein